CPVSGSGGSIGRGSFARKWRCPGWRKDDYYASAPRFALVRWTADPGQRFCVLVAPGSEPRYWRADNRRLRSDRQYHNAGYIHRRFAYETAFWSLPELSALCCPGTCLEPFPAH